MIAVLIAIFVIVGLPLIFVIAQYNALVSLRNYSANRGAMWTRN